MGLTKEILEWTRRSHTGGTLKDQDLMDIEAFAKEINHDKSFQETEFPARLDAAPGNYTHVPHIGFQDSSKYHKPVEIPSMEGYDAEMRIVKEDDCYKIDISNYQ